MPSLAKHAAPFEVSQVLAELADGDFLCLDTAGQITAAYPFSALPTRHRVQISGEATVFAMCAIDALGISAMTGRPVVIESADPSTGEPVTVHVDGATSTWNPATAVVYVGRTGDAMRRAVGVGLLRVHELLRHPGSRVGVGSLPPGDHRRHPGPSPRPASRHRHLRPATQLATRQTVTCGELVRASAPNACRNPPLRRLRCRSRHVCGQPEERAPWPRCTGRFPILCQPAAWRVSTPRLLSFAAVSGCLSPGSPTLPDAAGCIVLVSTTRGVTARQRLVPPLWRRSRRG